MGPAPVRPESTRQVRFTRGLIISSEVEFREYAEERLATGQILATAPSGREGLAVLGRDAAFDWILYDAVLDPMDPIVFVHRLRATRTYLVDKLWVSVQPPIDPSHVVLKREGVRLVTRARALRALTRSEFDMTQHERVSLAPRTGRAQQRERQRQSFQPSFG